MANFSNSDSGTEENATFTPQKEDFLEYQVALLLWKIWPPFVLLLGAFGNIATIFVMRRIKDHNSSQHAILTALAVSDFSLLYTGALRMWLIYLFRVDLRVLHSVMCKLHMWIVYSTSASSAWLVTTVTMQRTVAVKWPHRIKVLCSLRRTWIVIAVVVFTAFAVYFHVVPGKDIVGKTCTFATPEYKAFYRDVFTSLDMYLTSVIPSACLLVCNALLSWTLFKSSSLSSMTGRAVSQADDVNDKRKKLASRTTVMILTLSCAFLILTVPINVCIVWYNFAAVRVSQSPQLRAIKELLYAVTFMLWYLNSAINFLLYCLTGTKFRKEFLSWICCGSGDSSSAAVGDTAPGRGRGTG